MRKGNVGKIGDLGGWGFNKNGIKYFLSSQTDSVFFLFCFVFLSFLFAITALVINFTGNFPRSDHVSQWSQVHSATSGELMGYGGRRGLRRRPLFPG